MVDHQLVEIMTIITTILTIEWVIVEERTPVQVIEVADRWLGHQ